MCDEYELFEYLESEQRMEKRNRRLQMRQTNDPFEWEDEEFIKEYRYISSTLC